MQIVKPGCCSGDFQSYVEILFANHIFLPNLQQTSTSMVWAGEVAQAGTKGIKNEGEERLGFCYLNLLLIKLFCFQNWEGN